MSLKQAENCRGTERNTYEHFKASKRREKALDRVGRGKLQGEEGGQDVSKELDKGRVGGKLT